jgi:hypothetical protein
MKVEHNLGLPIHAVERERGGRERTDPGSSCLSSGQKTEGRFTSETFKEERNPVILQ